MSNWNVYVFSKAKQDSGFAQRAIGTLRRAGAVEELEDGEFAMCGSFAELNGESGNQIVVSPRLCALPEEAGFYQGWCPKCGTELGESFEALHLSLLGESVVLDERPILDTTQATCGACGWTGAFDEADSRDPDVSFQLRREYLGIYDTCCDDLDAAKAGLEALLPDALVMIVGYT